MTKELTSLFERDLNKLTEEIRAFQHEENLWKTTGQISNSAGNLCLHLVGNLNTYIGAILGNTGYRRDREAEFSQKGIPVTELLKRIREVQAVVSHTLQQLPEEGLQELYPQPILGHDMSTGFFLMHLHGHLNYHLGQINYLRRVLE
ncbi:DinB family protein [Pontibacter sp. JH31]|uniref:DinB family protein n=1 Tax=Pontibacter aquaedesilientis TaxID=2766980 RepID=A0ABR7XDV7_9BACT|nr:DinB family protein [Pontibacter aquaedesilientis]MBD1396483.1 DinB family protein [Pontibacter aquaedesilientis]